jgi:dihydroorotase
VLGPSIGSLASSLGQLQVGGMADVCVVDPQASWQVQAPALRSQSKHTPFGGYELPARVRATLVGGRVAFERKV